MHEKSWFWKFVFSVVMVVLGALLAGLINLWVTGCQISRRREAVAKALVIDVRACAFSAKRTAWAIDNRLMPDWVSSSPAHSHSFDTLSTDFWKAAAGDAENLPSESLARLVAFYGRVEHINARLRDLEQDQAKYAELRRRGVAQASAEKCRRIVLSNARVLLRLCRELAGYGELRDLAELPMEFDWSLHDDENASEVQQTQLGHQPP